MAIPAQKPGLSKQDYQTPKIFIDAVLKKLDINHFSWDLAADENNTVVPFRFYSEWNNAFDHDWAKTGEWNLNPNPGPESHEWLWLNPPFADIAPWAEKCYLSSKDGAKIALLVPASVGANWYKNYVHQKAFVLYLNGRLAFIPDKPDWKYPKDLMLCLYNGWAIGSDVWTWEKEK